MGEDYGAHDLYFHAVTESRFFAGADSVHIGVDPLQLSHVFF